ncbi:ribosomal subunit interface protein [Amylibacter marinus]|uniref:Ribosome hibernation promoting factor n=1 Tax=Amylibacter marinus TaxID=1475483 RepID=A0ABQ5VW51_9RHOB|nr:ribosome-associated translation inhibitor RaiA [Amylibacter marinus]GLQ35500.1 ribosomal subunit interface protein [Amylibacter marinus]
MRYKISGKQIDIGTSLQTHAETELAEILDKYAERPTDAIVTFSKDAHEYVCETAIHLSTGLSVNSKARATEIYDSFDKSAQRVEKQLRRYKRRLKDHANTRTTPIETFGASAYILASEEEDSRADETDLTPIIIAEMETGIKSLSVGEAVMQMELADESAIVFRNNSHDGLNVVYKRADGNIGWIDPQNMK